MAYSTESNVAAQHSSVSSNKAVPLSKSFVAYGKAGITWDMEACVDGRRIADLDLETVTKNNAITITENNQRFPIMVRPFQNRCELLRALGDEPIAWAAQRGVLRGKLDIFFEGQWFCMVMETSKPFSLGLSSRKLAVRRVTRSRGASGRKVYGATVVEIMARTYIDQEFEVRYCAGLPALLPLFAMWQVRQRLQDRSEFGSYPTPHERARSA